MCSSQGFNLRPLARFLFIVPGWYWCSVPLLKAVFLAAVWAGSGLFLCYIKLTNTSSFEMPVQLNMLFSYRMLPIVFLNYFMAIGIQCRHSLQYCSHNIADTVLQSNSGMFRKSVAVMLTHCPLALHLNFTYCVNFHNSNICNKQLSTDN